METVTRTRPVDGKAIGAAVLAGLAVLTSSFWLVSAVIATAAIAASLSSRSAVRQNPELRGVGLGVLAFLVSCVVLFLTLGPILLSTYLFALAPPSP